MILSGLLRAPRNRSALARHIEAASAASVRPADGERYLNYGVNPMRVLIIGSGIAVGYGAANRGEALDGQLGDRLATAFGRGVIINNLGEHGLRFADQIRSATVSLESGLVDLVVWCPSYIELADRTWAASWGTRLSQLLELAPSAPVVVMELPTPVGTEPAAVTAAPIISRINVHLRAATTRMLHVVTVAPPAVLIRPLGTPLFDATYYAELGEQVAAAAIPLLARSARSVTVPTA